jgi:hypothetical protein
VEMDNVWERIRKGVKEGAALSMEKIEEYTKVGKLKIEEFSVKRKIERNFVDMGERVFELISDEKGSEIEKDILINNSIENVNALKEELEEIKKRIQESSKEAKPGEDDEEITGI